MLLMRARRRSTNDVASFSLWLRVLSLCLDANVSTEHPKHDAYILGNLNF
jgi:hypothetical protein